MLVDPIKISPSIYLSRKDYLDQRRNQDKVAAWCEPSFNCQLDH